MENTKQNTKLAFANLIARQLKAVDRLDKMKVSGQLVRGLDSFEGLDNATDVRNQAEELLGYIGLGEEDLDQLDIFELWLDSAAVEVKLNGTKSLNSDSWNVQSVTAVLTTGGPQVEVTTRGGGELEVSVKVAGNIAKVLAYAPRLNSYLTELGYTEF